MTRETRRADGDGGLHLDDLGVDAGQYSAVNTSDARAGK